MIANDIAGPPPVTGRSRVEQIGLSSRIGKQRGPGNQTRQASLRERNTDVLLDLLRSVVLLAFDYWPRQAAVRRDLSAESSAGVDDCWLGLRIAMGVYGRHTYSPTCGRGTGAILLPVRRNEPAASPLLLGVRYPDLGRNEANQ